MEYISNFFAGYDLLYLAVILGIVLPALYKDILCHDSFNMTPQQQIADSFKWTGIWVLLALCLGVVTYFMKGAETAVQYIVGYGLEKSLAADNMFALMAIASAFGLMATGREVSHYKVLHYGIIGTIILSMLFLGTGAFLVGLPTTTIPAIDLGFISIPETEFSIPFMIFGLFILFSAYGIAQEAFGDEDDEDEVDYTQKWYVRATRKLFPVEPSIDSGKFFIQKRRDVRSSGTITYITPLFLALVCMEFANIGFSFDSMPVIVSVVDDKTVQLAAVLLAACGLRALYFALAAGKQIWCHLDKAVVVLLVWIGAKIIAESVGIHLIAKGMEGSFINLGVVLGILGLGIAASYVWPTEEEEDDSSTAGV